MKILLNIVLSLVVIVAGVYAGQRLLQPAPAVENGKPSHDTSTEQSAGTQTGPHGGRLLEDDDLQLEITIHERGVPPEFRVYAYSDGKPLDPETVDLTIELSRLGGEVDRFTFQPHAAYLIGDATVTEPHSFDVRVQAQYAGHDYQWQYEQHEGRTKIAAAQARAADIETAAAGSAEIHQTVTLQGRVRHDTAHLHQVRARYPGLVQSATKAVGNQVQAGETLARVESNDSLQTYSIVSPIDGVVIEQRVTSGEAITDQALYVIANLDRVWVDLAVFREQMETVQVKQKVRLQTLDGSFGAEARIDYLLPTTAGRSQATVARIYLDNADRRWRPGMAVTGTVTLSREEVPLAVRNSALQTFRDFDVVFVRFNDTYEVRMLELGRSDGRHTEVLGGLKPGTEYVVNNSYLLKADIDKSGAAHVH